MRNGDMPASPLTTSCGALWNLRDGHEDSNYLSQPTEKFSIGLTKREYFAVMAMQGILSNGVDFALHDDRDVAAAAVLHADLLLTELERTK